MAAKILLVEDNYSLAYGLIYSLKHEGYDVVHAETISDAGIYFSKGGFSLILLDVMLPDGNGYDFCTDVRKTSQVPIIFLTACDDEVNIIAGFDTGADDYITKPFRIQVLLSRIKAVMRRCSTQSAEEYPDLTLIESRLVNILKSNSGITLTRGRILEALWDNRGEFVDDNTLSVHIKRLRNKIGSEHIITVRGVGYRWMD